MLNKISIADLPNFDPAEHLKDDADIAAYLTLVIGDGDAFELSHALNVVARARGMNEIARIAGITREGLYKASQPGTQPRFDILNHVCQALNV